MIAEETWNSKFKDLVIRHDKSYSQHREEQIIDFVFSLCKPKNKWCVDVGATDGINLSNTYKLIENGWKSIQVEAEKGFFEQLQETYRGYRNIFLCNKVVDNGFFSTENNLSFILKEYQVPQDFDFLSVDIDSYDYEVLRSIFPEFLPNLICIECNSVEEDFSIIDYLPTPYPLQRRENDFHMSYRGATVGLLNQLAGDNGYTFICVEKTNAFYIKNDFAEALLK